MNEAKKIAAKRGTALADKRTINFWHTKNDSDTVIVMVHGIFADGVTCWTNKRGNTSSGKYWPDFIAGDKRFGSPSIYMAGYHTELGAGDFSIADCARQVLTALGRQDSDGTPPPLAKRRIVFVCHSTGGIIVRYLIERNRKALSNRPLGLVLIASPSVGSVWANIFSLAAVYYNQQLGRQLKIGNEILEDLHRSFRDLVNSRETELPGFLGKEACEHKMVGRRSIPSWIVWLLPPRFRVVSRHSAGQYFGDVTVLPGTDHFSAVKPDGINHPSHDFLVDFWTEFSSHTDRYNRMEKEMQISKVPIANGGPVSLIRVSVAALLRLQLGEKFLVIRNLQRPELFGPLGGVYKYHDGALAALEEIGFLPERHGSRISLNTDLQHDLRGYVDSQHLATFRAWFALGIDRETTDCLTRELTEELLEVDADSSLISSVSNMTFRPVRTIIEGPSLTPYGHEQFRILDIYEPDLSDSNNEPRNRDIVEKIFREAEENPSMLAVTSQAIEQLRSPGGQVLAPTVDYFFQEVRRAIEPVPFGRK